MHFGQNASQNLKREFSEETGLDIEVKAYLFTHEYLAAPLHAMEHFFSVEKIGGNLVLGSDPELNPASQIIEEVKWMSMNEIRSLPNEALHQIFWGIKSLKDLVLLRGYFNFENNSLK
jgi:8-oxo-dGTP diphosphatase